MNSVSLLINSLSSVCTSLYSALHLQHTNSQLQIYLCISIIRCRFFFDVRDRLPFHVVQTLCFIFLPFFLSPFRLPSFPSLIVYLLLLFSIHFVLLFYSSIHPLLAPISFFFVFYYLSLLFSFPLPSLSHPPSTWVHSWWSARNCFLSSHFLTFWSAGNSFFIQSENSRSLESIKLRIREAIR